MEQGREIRNINRRITKHVTEKFIWMGGLDATGSEVFLHSEGPSTRLLFVDAKSCAIYSEQCAMDGRLGWRMRRKRWRRGSRTVVAFCSGCFFEMALD